MAKDQVQITFKVFNEEFKKGMSEMRESTTRLNREFRLQKEQMKLTGSEADKLRANVGYLNERYGQAQERVKATEEQLAKAKKTFGENSTEVKKLEDELMNARIEEQRFANQLKEVSQELKVAENKALQLSETLKKTGAGMQEAGKKIDEAGKKMTTRLTLPIAGAGVAAGKMSIDFNKSMASISTLIPGENERIHQLKADIQDVAIVSGKSTDDIASGTYDVISAYGDASDTMEKVETNAKAAAAGMASTSDALNLSSAIMKGYGDTSAEANKKVMDLAFQTLVLGQTSFPELAASMGKVVPTSNELGISQEQLFAVYATATGVTGNASEVSTQYQGALKALMAPTKDMTKLMEGLGVENGKAMIEQYGLIGSMEKIVEASRKSGKPLQSYIGSIQGQVLALALAGEQNDVYKAKLGELTNSSGAMERAFKEQTEGINATGFSFEQSMIKMQVSAQKMGDAMAPAISKIADSISDWTDKLSKLSPEQQEMIIKAGLAVAALGPLTSAVGKTTEGAGKLIEGVGKVSGKLGELQTGAGGASSSMGGLASTFSAMANPIGLTTVAIAGLVGGISYALYKSDEAFREAGKAGESFIESVASWHDGVGAAKSALEGFNMETIISSEKMTELETKINEAQQKIIGIAETAAAESREYTEKERQQIEELIGLIADYTEQKVEAYNEQARVVAAMATQERDVTLQRAQELIKGAEDAKEQTLAIAQARYTDQVGEAQKLYGYLGELDKERYDEMVANAKTEYDQQVESANKIHGDTLSIVQQKYLDYDQEGKNHLQDIARLNKELEELEKNKNAELIENKEWYSSESRANAQHNLLVERQYKKDRDVILKQLGEAFKKAEDDNLSAWLGMAAEAELYGGEINQDTIDLASGMISALDHLPSGSKETMADAMQGMSSEMSAREPGLFKKASNIAGGILKTLRSAFDIRSPSRKMAEIMELVFDGADKPFEDAEKEMADKSRTVAENMMDAFGSTELTPNFNLSSIPKYQLAGSAGVLPISEAQSITGPTINFYGNYSFRDKDDVDYFLSQSAVRLKRREY